MKRLASYISLAALLPVSLLAMVTIVELDDGADDNAAISNGSAIGADRAADIPNLSADDPPAALTAARICPSDADCGIVARIVDVGFAPVHTLLTRIHPKNGPPTDLFV